MAIDYSQRPSGMSKREYSASILGGKKEDYSSSRIKSTAAPEPYEAKQYDYKDFVDTSGLDKAYGSARETYLGQITALKPRYEELYKQLEASKSLAQEKETALSGEEQTAQKRALAKRGIEVSEADTFYTQEKGKLETEQSRRARETELAFSGQRLDIAGAESADIRDINTAVANLDLSKANTITNMISSAKQFAAGLTQQEADRARASGRDAIADAQWEQTFAYTKSKDAADRSLALYNAAKAETRSGNEAYNTALSSLVSSAYSTEPKPYARERIAKELESQFPDQSKRVGSDIQKYFPDGWESQAASAVKGGIGSDEGGRYYDF